MKKTTSLLGIILLGIAWRHCEVCDDSFVPAMQVSFENADGSELQPTESALLRLEKIDAAGNSLGFLPISIDPRYEDPAGGVDAGRYRIHVTIANKPVANVPVVCTKGHKTGCDTKTVKQDEIPIIIIRKTDTNYSVVVQRNGPCQ